MDTDAVRQNVSQALADVRETTATITAGAGWTEVLILFGGVPALLVLVEVAIGLDAGVFASIERRQFYFEVGQQPLFSLEGIVAAYRSTIGQGGVWHLRPNLVGYLLVVGTTYPLAIIARRKRRVLGLLLVVLLGAPLVSVAVTVHSYPTGTRVLGGSGVVAALVGLLSPVLFLAADRRLSAPLNPVWAGSVVCAVTAGLAVGEGEGALAAGAAALALVFLAGMAWRLGTGALIELTKFVVEPGQYPFWLGIAVAYVGTISLTVVDAPRTNLVAHLGGYYFGFLVGLVGLSRQPRRR